MASFVRCFRPGPVWNDVDFSDIFNCCFWSLSWDQKGSTWMCVTKVVQVSHIICESHFIISHLTFEGSKCIVLVVSTWSHFVAKCLWVLQTQNLKFMANRRHRFGSAVVLQIWECKSSFRGASILAFLYVRESISKSIEIVSGMDVNAICWETAWLRWQLFKMRHATDVSSVTLQFPERCMYVT